MQTQTVKYFARFDLNSGERVVVNSVSDYVVDSLVRYLGMEVHQLVPLVSYGNKYVQVELQVQQNKLFGLEQKIKEINEHLKQNGWLKSIDKV